MDQLFNFKEKYNNSAADSFVPENTVMGNDPVIIPTSGVIKVSAVR